MLGRGVGGRVGLLDGEREVAREARARDAVQADGEQEDRVGGGEGGWGGSGVVKGVVEGEVEGCG